MGGTNSNAVSRVRDLRKAEVNHMCITEYNEEKHDRQLITEAKDEEGEEGRTDGEAKSRIEGIIEILSDLVKDGIMSIEGAAMKAHMSISDVEAKAVGLKI